MIPKVPKIQTDQWHGESDDAEPEAKRKLANKFNVAEEPWLRVVSKVFQNIERRTVFYPRICSSFPLEDAAFPEWKVITLIVWRLVDQLLLLSAFSRKIDWLFRPDSFVHCNGKSFVWLFWFIFTRSVRSLIIPPNCYCFGRCHLTLGSFYIILLYVCTRIWSESNPPAAFQEPPQLPVNEAGSSFEICWSSREHPLEADSLQ